MEFLKKKRILTGTLLLLFYIIIGIGSFMIFNYYLNYKRILTPLENNFCVSTVKLSKGILYFNNLKFNYDFTNEKDNIEKYTKKISKEDFINKTSLNTDFYKCIPEYMNETTTNTQISYYNLDGNLLDDKFIFNFQSTSSEKECSLVMYVSSTNYNNYILTPPDNFKRSKMIDTQLSIYYYKDNNNLYHYACEFYYDNLYYIIESVNITQKSFINYLFSIIS